jgi:hypothetical protein
MRSSISRTGLGECSVSWAGAFQIGSARRKPALWQTAVLLFPDSVMLSSLPCLVSCCALSS